jgi:hypothetical protein
MTFKIAKQFVRYLVVIMHEIPDIFLAEKFRYDRE